MEGHAYFEYSSLWNLIFGTASSGLQIVLLVVMRVMK
jgi:hypothetical protein